MSLRTKSLQSIRLFALLSWLTAAPAARAQQAVEVVFPGAAPGAARAVAEAPIDQAQSWGDSNLSEDAPLSYRQLPSAGRDNGPAVAMTFDADVGPIGMKYLQLPDVAGSDGLAFWVRGDGSGATLQVRLSQADWSAWDSPTFRLDFQGWRRLVFRREQCNYHNWGGNGPRWNTLRIFALRLSGPSCRVVLDDLTFYENTAAMQVIELPPAEAVTLRVDGSRELPAVGAHLRGVDFALVNWGASSDDLTFGPEMQQHFADSGAELVRFWTYCPPLQVSPAEGEYDWTRFDAQMRRINQAGAATIMTCCFTPTWLSVDGTKEGLPRDWDAYERLIADTVRHCNQQGFDVAYWEAWNEPDLSGGGFLKGDLDDFLTLYAHFARAVRSADPDAKVGGPATAGANVQWIAALADYCVENDLPLDFVSWHVYDLPPIDTARSIDTMRRAVTRHRSLADVEYVIDEWNVSGGPENAYDTAYAAAGQVATLIAMGDRGLDASTFFCFNDSAYQANRQVFGGAWGMLTHTGLRKASFHSFQLFADMTGPRVDVSGGDEEISAIACRAGDGVDVLIARFQPEDRAEPRPVSLDLRNLPLGQRVRVMVDLVDNAHSNPLYDLDATALEEVAVIDPITINGLNHLQLPMMPWSVARLRIRPSAVDSAEPPAVAGLTRLEPIGGGSSVESPMPAGAALTRWSPADWPRPMLVAEDGSPQPGQLIVSPPAAVAQPHLGFAVAVDEHTGRAETVVVPAVPAGVYADTRIESPAPWRAGQRYRVEVRTHRRIASAVEARVDLEATGATVAPAEGGGYSVTVDDNAGGGEVILRPAVEVTNLLDANGGPRIVASPATTGDRLLADDDHALLAGPMGSAEQLAEIGGQFEGADPTFTADGVVPGPAAVRIASDQGQLPGDVGSIELIVTPDWDAADAPSWGTLMIHSGPGPWEQNRLELLFRRDGQDQPVLRFDFNDARGQSHRLDAVIDDWRAGQAHHILATWNRHTRKLNLWIDGAPAGTMTLEAGLALESGPIRLGLNPVSGRPPSGCAFGAIRISDVQRVPGDTLTPPDVPVCIRGLKIPVAP